MVAPVASSSEQASEWFKSAQASQWRHVRVVDRSGQAFRNLRRHLVQDHSSSVRIEELELVGSLHHRTLLSVDDLSAIFAACLWKTRDPATRPPQVLRRVTLKNVFLVYPAEGKGILEGVVMDILRLERVEEASYCALARLLGIFKRVNILYVDQVSAVSMPNEQTSLRFASLGALDVRSLRVTKTGHEGVARSILELLSMRGELRQLIRLQIQCRSVDDLLAVFEVVHRSSRTLENVSLDLVDAWNLGVPDVALDEEDSPKSQSRYLEFYHTLPVLSTCTKLTDFSVFMHINTTNPTQNVWRWRALESLLYHLPPQSLRRVQVVLLSTLSNDAHVQPSVASQLGTAALESLDWMFVDRACALLKAANKNVVFALRTAGEFLPEQKEWIQAQIVQLNEAGAQLEFPAYPSGRT